MIKLYLAKINDFTQADYANMYSLLDCALKEKIDSKKNEKAKKLSLLGYILLYRGFSEIYNKTDVKLYFNSKGKPFCDFCYFSISHSNDMAICVFDDRLIGADIQYFHTVKQREKYKFFNQKENFYVNCEKSDVSQKYIEIFAKKEAAIKMHGWSIAQAADIDTFSDKYSFTIKKTDDYVIALCSENRKIM